MKKTSPVFLLPEDEASVATAIAGRFPETKIVDGVLWPSADPPIRKTISDCEHRDVLLWPSAIFPRLPVRQTHHTYFEGPLSGVVVRWTRNRLSNDGLEVGAFSVGLDEDAPKEMQVFVKGVWNVLFKETSNTLVRNGDIRLPEPSAKGKPDGRYRVGKVALTEALAKGLVFVDEVLRLTPN